MDTEEMIRPLQRSNILISAMSH